MCSRVKCHTLLLRRGDNRFKLQMQYFKKSTLKFSNIKQKIAGWLLNFSRQLTLGCCFILRLKSVSGEG